MYLRVTKTGIKTFYKREQGGGKSRWVPVGRYPDITLLEARTRAADCTPAEGVTTVEEVYRLFDVAVLSKYKRPGVSQGRFALDILPALGGKAIAAVTRLDVTGMLAKIVGRGSPVAANRTLADVKHLFQFALERGYIHADPTAGVTRKYVGGKETPREVVVDIEDVLALRHKRSKISVASAVAIYLCLLTGQRAGEVLWIMANANWRDRWVEIPDSKSRRPHKVFLSLQVRAALRVVRDVPLPKDVRVLSHALRRLSASFTPHDLRRTMATKLSDAGVAPHVIEKMLNHRMEGVMAVYNRAEYLPERKAGWILWGKVVAATRHRCRIQNQSPGAD